MRIQNTFCFSSLSLVWVCFFFFISWLRPCAPFCTILEEHKLRITLAYRISCLEVDPDALHSAIQYMSKLCMMHRIHHTIPVPPSLYELSQSKSSHVTNTGLRDYGSTSGAFCFPQKATAAGQLVLQQSLCLLHFCQRG